MSATTWPGSLISFLNPRRERTIIRQISLTAEGEPKIMWALSNPRGKSENSMMAKAEMQGLSKLNRSNLAKRNPKRGSPLQRTRAIRLQDLVRMKTWTGLTFLTSRVSLTKMKKRRPYQRMKEVWWAIRALTLMLSKGWLETEWNRYLALLRLAKACLVMQGGLHAWQPEVKGLTSNPQPTTQARTIVNSQRVKMMMFLDSWSRAFRQAMVWIRHSLSQRIIKVWMIAERIFLKEI